ncbi:GNAT family N-acetyltransferase [Pseudoroseomonas oryzae]|uniref:GNAT family N-acetyltransferase n=2 Tax=Teichococcus oryzae TaxID=1608942 RepID=A0A5B2TNY4_9PROT|nr:GNAT family N-acetyltransferase [Pseudoroseomonas oryzae]
MRAADLAAVSRIATIVHRDFPEEDAVFAERLALFPAGCLILARGGEAAGYAISHPWRLGAPPALNTRLVALPARPDTFYLHDVALLAEARGGGAARGLLARLEQLAGVLPVSLVAVGGTADFWRRLGFVAVEDPALDAKLASYGDPSARFMVRHRSG